MTSPLGLRAGPPPPPYAAGGFLGSGKIYQSAQIYGVWDSCFP